MRTRAIELKIKRAKKGFFWWEVSTTCHSAEGGGKGIQRRKVQRRKRGGGTNSQREGERNKVGRNTPEAVRTSSGPSSFHRLSFSCSGPDGQDAPRAGGEDRKLQKALFSSFPSFISTPHLMAHTVPF